MVATRKSVSKAGAEPATQSLESLATIDEREAKRLQTAANLDEKPVDTTLGFYRWRGQKFAIEKHTPQEWIDEGNADYELRKAKREEKKHTNDEHVKEIAAATKKRLSLAASTTTTTSLAPPASSTSKDGKRKQAETPDIRESSEDRQKRVRSVAVKTTTENVRESATPIEEKSKRVRKSVSAEERIRMSEEAAPSRPVASGRRRSHALKNTTSPFRAASPAQRPSKTASSTKRQRDKDDLSDIRVTQTYSATYKKNVEDSTTFSLGKTLPRNPAPAPAPPIPEEDEEEEEDDEEQNPAQRSEDDYTDIPTTNTPRMSSKAAGKRKVVSSPDRRLIAAAESINEESTNEHSIDEEYINTIEGCQQHRRKYDLYKRKMPKPRRDAALKQRNAAMDELRDNIRECIDINRRIFVLRDWYDRLKERPGAFDDLVTLQIKMRTQMHQPKYAEYVELMVLGEHTKPINKAIDSNAIDTLLWDAREELEAAIATEMAKKYDGDQEDEDEDHEGDEEDHEVLPTAAQDFAATRPSTMGGAIQPNTPPASDSATADNEDDDAMEITNTEPTPPTSLSYDDILRKYRAGVVREYDYEESSVRPPPPFLGAPSGLLTQDGPDNSSTIPSFGTNTLTNASFSPQVQIPPPFPPKDRSGAPIRWSLNREAMQDPERAEHAIQKSRLKGEGKGARRKRIRRERRELETWMNSGEDFKGWLGMGTTEEEWEEGWKGKEGWGTGGGGGAGEQVQGELEESLEEESG